MTRISKTPFRPCSEMFFCSVLLLLMIYKGPLILLFLGQRRVQCIVGSGSQSGGGSWASLGKFFLESSPNPFDGDLFSPLDRNRCVSHIRAFPGSGQTNNQRGAGDRWVGDSWSHPNAHFWSMWAGLWPPLGLSFLFCNLESREWNL